MKIISPSFEIITPIDSEEILQRLRKLDELVIRVKIRLQMILALVS